MNILDIRRKALGYCFLKGDGGGGGGGSANDGNAGEAEAKANMAPAPTPSGPGAQDPAQQQQAAVQAQADAAATAAAQAQAAADAASPFGAMSEGFKTTPENQRAMADSAMSQGFKMTPDNAGAQADQAAVRDFLARVEADKRFALSKPGEQYNVNNPNVGTNLTNALDAAINSGLNTQTIHMSAGKNNPDGRDVTTYTTNIPVARFLGYTGDPGNSAISYGEAQQLKDLGMGNLTGVNLKNMPGTGLSVAGGDGMPIPGLTYNEPGQTADSIVAATDAAEIAGKLWDGLKNFIPGYGLAMMVGNLLSGKMTLGDAILSVGLGNLARSIGTTPGTLTALANGNFADAVTGQLTGYAVKDIANTYKVDPRVVSVGLGMSGAPQAVGKELSAGNMNLGTTRALSNAIQSPINAAANAVGTSFGTGESTGQITNTGDTLGDQIDRAVGTGSSPATPVAPATPAPASGTPSTPTSPLSSLSIPSIGGAGSSAGSSSSGALSDSGAAKASTSADSALKSSYLGGTGNAKATDKEMKSMTDPLSANSSSVIKSEDTSNTQTAKTDPFKYDFYAYGDVPDISANLQVKDGGSISSPLVEANRVVHKTSGGGIMTTPLMAAAGGVPHKGSHYVQGAGGGQDDLIDARLADGEYVFDADVVSALGDGSNKEGAKKLDAMRESIRKHKRSAPVNKIPPMAKSPLAYMRG